MMKTTLKIFLELVAVLVLTFMLSSEYIFIANAYNIPCLSYFFSLHTFCAVGYVIEVAGCTI